MKALMRSAIAALMLLFAAAPALAAPLSYINTPLDTVQAASNAVITSYNASQTPAAPLVTCSGTTTSTCTGLRFTVSITGLVTAASTLSASMVVTNTSVTAVSQVNCMVNGYAGTGVPVAVNLVNAAGTTTFAIQNVATGAALNATVPVACQVFN